ncbi:hypothetical protein [uncultured Gammaproteobacteria bacterium]|jgi:hypothetical protein|nr:hypothetical protein [uncultured Gammaproteobacteria bacterium]CAC9587957.1 hypothetical protein [uncultured Gammaproteobacteria bacterium]
MRKSYDKSSLSHYSQKNTQQELQTALNNHLNDTTKVRPMDSHQL